jgi:hypothetical protein
MQQQSIAFGWKLGAIDILQNTGANMSPPTTPFPAGLAIVTCICLELEAI